MKHRKKLIAGIMAAMMMVTSLQLPGGTVFATELVETDVESVTPLAGEGVEAEEADAENSAGQGELSEVENLPDTGEEEDDNGLEEPDIVGGGAEVPSGTDEDELDDGGTEQVPGTVEGEESAAAGSGSESGVEETPDEEDGDVIEVPDEENDTVSVSDNTVQVSGNDLEETEVQETIVIAELDAAYQFGGAPSEPQGKARQASGVAAYSDGVEEYVYARMLAREEEIDVSEYNIPASQDALGNLVSGVLNEHPDLYFVNKGCSANTNGTIITALLITYNNTYDDAAFQSAVKTALATVNQSMSDLQKAIVLHDYLAINCEYDKVNLDNNSVPMVSHSAYGTFVNRTAVCDGYALAYKYLLNQLGINCYMVTSDAMNHAWNLIELDGAYYQVDVTWDDPTWDRIGRAAHTYMFCSDEVFKDTTHKHHDWSVTYGSEVVDYAAVDTRYDSAFWAECKSPLVLEENNCYYLTSGGSLKKADFSDVTNEGITVQPSIGSWPVWGDNGNWIGAFSGLFQIDGRLFYNDKENIYSIAMDGTNRLVEFTADTTDGYIYGSALCQGEVRYALHKDPNETGKENILVADIEVGGGEPDVPDTPGDDENTLNLENLTAEYTALDDTKISSVAAGKPKLLIFYSNTCYNSINTIKSISAEIDAFGRADVYAIETNKNTKESVEEFKNQNGCDEIVFSYDTGESNSSSMWAYARLAGIVENNKLTWPVICYIGANNRLQFVTKSITTADDVLAKLKKYCDYSYEAPPTYKITYILNGGTNNGSNPKKYTMETDTIVLQDAVREGYRFDGWYMDETFLVKITQIEKGRTGDLTLYAKWVKDAFSLQGANISLKTAAFIYDGMEQKPKVAVFISDGTQPDGKRELLEGQDYELSYIDNTNAGTATAVINGINDYSGMASKNFEIEPASLVIRAKDKSILIGASIPTESQYEYETIGLISGDSLIVKPAFSCTIVNSAVAGRYDIVPYGADAGTNYTVSYEKGTLVVAEEYVSCAVIFDVQGHGTAPDDQFGIKVGNTIEKPADPAAEGYRFDGWYRDVACTKIWNFETDIVQTDLTLYAKWLTLGMDTGSGSFALQEIADIYYTGKPCKPAVSVYDGGTLLKAGKDYQIKYYNNTNVNAGDQRKTGNGTGTNFNDKLPYVEIVGKGNYEETVKVNFNILKASIGDGGESPAVGVTLKVNDQLVKANKVLKPFSSIKYVKAMRLNTDYTLSLTAANACDESGESLSVGTELVDAKIPAGYSGEFQLTVTGAGNYEGSVCKTIYVADKAHLIKNAKITLGKNLKNIQLVDKTVKLTAATEEGPDVFTVKYGSTVLVPGQDYTCNPSNLEFDRAGKAELTIIGKGEYAGSKTVTFNIKGKTFSAKAVKVEGLENKEYTGRALTQNNVTLIYCGANTSGEIPLQYGKDYSIIYSKNVNKGTATMTFKGKEEAGYSGSFKKTFKITAVDIADDGLVKQAEEMKNLAFSYCKTGVKPVEEIQLTNKEGFVLQNGKDYTLRYVNNKSVAKAGDEKPPTVVVKGKGNYRGELKVYFQIDKADLKEISVKTTPVAYKSNKAADYVYKPSVKLMDGKKALRAGVDYEIEYRNNTQADYEDYIGQWENLSVTDSIMPVAVIKEKEDSSYTLEGLMTVPLPIYQKQMKKANLEITVQTGQGETVYTGGQVTPPVTVYYTGETGKIPLAEGKDYTVSYGANNKSGKNKGSVTISGIAPAYGGSVTVKFNILKKSIAY